MTQSDVNVCRITAKHLLLQVCGVNIAGFGSNSGGVFGPAIQQGGGFYGKQGFGSMGTTTGGGSGFPFNTTTAANPFGVNAQSKPFGSM
jgi:hypothetical protein